MDDIDFHVDTEEILIGLGLSQERVTTIVNMMTEQEVLNFVVINF